MQNGRLEKVLHLAHKDLTIDPWSSAKMLTNQFYINFTIFGVGKTHQ